jgi:hypothetical protein
MSWQHQWICQIWLRMMTDLPFAWCAGWFGRYRHPGFSGVVAPGQSAGKLGSCSHQCLIDADFVRFLGRSSKATRRLEFFRCSWRGGGWCLFLLQC